jgi:hypothetical protein
LETDVNGGNFTVLDPQMVNTSHLHSAEANLWWHMGDRLRLLAGFRWVGLDDHYDVNSTGAIFPVPVTLSNNAFNNLFGAQIGGDVTLLELGLLTVNLAGKAGGYGNSSGQNSREVDTGFVDRQVSATLQHGHAAFVGELALTGTFEVVESRLYFRGGYQALWIDGVLLAPDQIAVNNFAAGTAGLRYNTLFAHGAYLGMELRF